MPARSKTGRESTACICPLDPDWREYYAESLRRYAAEDFRIIWIDDDIRLHNHGNLEWGGCFCPRHVAAFNELAGTDATREEIVTACTAPGEPHPWREIWMTMWDETQCELVASWRDCVTPGGAKLGLMTSLMEQHAAEGRRWKNWWQAIAGDDAPVVRPHFWGYTNMSGYWLPEFMARLDQNRTVFPKQIEYGPEIECFPFGAWNNSFRQIGARMALAHILGSTNLNISIYDFMGNAPDDEPERATFLKRWRPVCDLLADEFGPHLQSVSVGTPWPQTVGRRIHTDESGKWQSLVGSTRRWCSWLGAAGQAFSMQQSPAVNALSGDGVWAFDDDELQAWLRQGLLLDGEAALALVERGFGAAIGVDSGRFIVQDEVCYSVEQSLDAEFALRAGAQMSVNCESYAARLFQGELADGARVVSDLRSPTQDVVGHGLVLYENDAGGRIGIVPWTADDCFSRSMNVQRATQLRKVMAWLDPDHHRGAVSGGPWLFPQFLTDGTTWRGAIWNGNDDPVSQVHVELPTEMPAPNRVLQITGDGEMIPVTMADGVIDLERPLMQWEVVVLL